MARLGERSPPLRRDSAHLALLKPEEDNFRAALEWATQQDAGGLGLRLTSGAFRLWQQTGHYLEGSTWCDRVLRLPSAASVATAARATTLLDPRAAARLSRRVSAGRGACAGCIRGAPAPRRCPRDRPRARCSRQRGFATRRSRASSSRACGRAPQLRESGSPVEAEQPLAERPHRLRAWRHRGCASTHSGHRRHRAQSPRPAHRGRPGQFEGAGRRLPRVTPRRPRPSSRRRWFCVV